MTPRPFAVCSQIVDVQHRLAEELLDALRLQCQQPALNRADRCGRYVAVLGRQLGRVLADVLQHRAQVLEVEQQEARVVGDLEREVQHAFLRVVQLQQPARAAADPNPTPSRGSDARAGRTRPRTRRDRPRSEGRCRAPRHAPRPSALFAAGRGEPREIAFDVGHEDRHADAARTSPRASAARPSCPCPWRP